MELIYQLFKFLVILKESFHLYPKIWKFTVANAAISILVPSLFFLIFSCANQIYTDGVDQNVDSVFNKYLVIIMVAETLFLVVFFAISLLSSTCTIIASDAAYKGQTISPSHLLCRLREIWRSSLIASGLRACLSSFGILFFTSVAVIIMDLINPIHLWLIVVLYSALLIIELRSSVAHHLTFVASVVEESSEESQPMERGQQLAQGQRLKGFMLNLFMNSLILGCFLVFWAIVGDKGESMDLTVYGLFLVIVLAIVRTCDMVAYTLFYVECKNERLGQETTDDAVGEIEYSKLSAASV